MTHTPFHESKIIKEIYAKMADLKQKLDEELNEIKECVKTLKEINEDKHALNNKDVEIAWVQFRLDYLTGVKKVSSERFKSIKNYMDNIDLNNIPFELKYYIKEENTNENN